jgi:hypothetical protein
MTKPPICPYSWIANFVICKLGYWNANEHVSFWLWNSECGMLQSNSVNQRDKRDCWE